MLRIFTSALAALGVWLSLSTAAAAEPDRSATVYVNPTAAAELRVAVVAAAERAVDRAGRTVVDVEPALGRGLAWDPLAACLQARDPQCLRTTAASASAESLLVIDVKSEGEASASDVVLTAWLVDVADGTSLATEQRFCETCTDKDLTGATQGLVDSVLASAAAVRAEDTYLEVITVPAGARVVVDGAPLGPSGRAYRLAPGVRHVTVDMPGYVPVTRDVALGGNESKTVTIELASLSDEPEGGRSGMWKWATLGTGAGLTALGVAWIAVDGERFDDDGRLREQRDTLVPGIIATTAGAVLLSTSVYLFLSRDEEGAATVAAVPTAGGAFFSFSRRF